MQPPATRHAQVCYRAAYLLGQFVEELHLGRILCNGPTLQLSGSESELSRPDLAYISYRRLPREEFPEGYLAIAPELAIHVVMPGDDWSALEQAVERYLDQGVAAVGLLDVETESVHLARPRRDPHVVLPMRTVELADILPGWRVEARDFFV